MSVIGQRVLRKEDPRFLTGAGRATSTTSSSTVRSTSPSCARRSRTRGSRGSTRAWSRTALRASPPPTSASSRSPRLPGFIEQRMARPPLARDVVRFAGDIVAVVLTDTRERGHRRGRARPRRLRPAAGRGRPRRVAARRGPALPGRRQQRLRAHLRRSDEGICSRAARSSSRARGQPADGSGAARAALVPRPGSRTAACTPGSRPRRRTRTATAWRRRWVWTPADVRVVAPDVGGGFGAKGSPPRTSSSPGWPGRRAAGALDRDAQREHARDRPRPGSADGLHDRRQPRREGQAYKLDVLHDAGAYPGIGAFLPTLTQWMQAGVYAIPEIGVRVELGRHEHRADDRLPRRRAARGGAGDRAGDRHIRRPRSASTRPRRAPENFDRARTRSRSTTTSGRHLRLRRLRALRSTARSRPPATTTFAPSRRRRREAGDAQQLGIGLSVYVEITNGGAEPEFGAVEITPEGGADRAHRLVLARAGPRDGVRAGRRRPARTAARRR